MMKKKNHSVMGNAYIKTEKFQISLLWILKLKIHIAVKNLGNIFQFLI
jgi:hypothetical protein